MSDVISVNTTIEEAEWSVRKAALLESASLVVKVENQDELEAAGLIEANGKKLIKELETARKRVTSPLDDLKKRIMANEKKLRKDIESEVARINKMTSAYATHIAKLAEDERERIEREEMAAAEAAAAASSANAMFGLDSDIASPIVPAIVPSVKRPMTSSNRFVETWDFSIYNPSSVPREFLSVDDKKIRAFIASKKAEGYKANQVEIPGIKITSTVQVYSR